MSHRRRGADFSHLFETFRKTTDCRTDLEPSSQLSSSERETTASETYDGNKRVNLKRSTESDSSGTCSFKSTILAGQIADSESQGSTEHSYQTAQSGSVAASSRCGNASADSWRLEAPSVMNQAVGKKFEPQSDLDLTQSTTERHSGELNKNINLDKSFDEIRDTNYNIEEKAAMPTTNLCRGISSPRRLPKYQSSPKAKDCWTVLSKLDNVLDPSGDKSVKTKDKILRRLSQEFMYSPRTFTERLVTIIDESETGHGLDTHEASGVNLSRMTKEFRKMCKFIQDESMPEWAPTFCGNSILETSKYPEHSKHTKSQRPETIEESPTTSYTEDVKTPENDSMAARKVYRKTPLNIFKNTFQERYNKAVGSPGSPDSTKEFEKLEKFVEALPYSPKSSSRKLRRSFSTPEIAVEPTRQQLAIKCEELLRSLDDTNCNEFATFDSHRGQRTEDPEVEQPLASADTATSQPVAICEEFDEDALSTSLLIEWRKKRQRCFDTAMKIQQIEKDSNNANEEVLNRHGIDPGTAFMKTISTCFAYQNSIAVMRQNDNLKRTEGSSADSGIDTRSIPRTPRASSKKPLNTPASGRITSKPSSRCESSSKNLRLKGVSTPRWKSSKPGTNVLKTTERKIESPTNAQRQTMRKIATPSNAQHKTVRKLDAPSNAQQKTPRKIETPSNAHHKTVRKIDAPSNAVQNIDKPIFNAQHEPQHKAVRKIDAPSIAVQTIDRPIYNASPRRNVPSACSTESPTQSPTTLEPPKTPRRKFFVTPGKSAPVSTNKRTFFSNIDNEVNDDASSRVMKSLYAPGLYRQGFNTVISPVGMYIHGTDMNLIQNTRAKKNEMLLTPSKAAASEETLKFKLSGKKSTPRNKPRTNRLFVDKEDSNSQSDSNDENIEEPDFALPKATYKLPAQVHMVNESPTYNLGARTRELLQSIQNRVVIRHEGNRLGKHDDQQVPENDSESADMSIHVQKPAKKTNYMSHWK